MKTLTWAALIAAVIVFAAARYIALLAVFTPFYIADAIADHPHNNERPKP